MSPIEKAKDLHSQIKKMELALMYGKNPTTSFEDFMTLTYEYLSITKPVNKYPSTNTNQNLY